MQLQYMTEKEVHLKCNPDSQFMGACNSAGKSWNFLSYRSTFSVNLNSAIGQSDHGKDRWILISKCGERNKTEI